MIPMPSMLPKAIGCDGGVGVRPKVVGANRNADIAVEPARMMARGLGSRLGDSRTMATGTSVKIMEKTK
jgi:hypothetical protein